MEIVLELDALLSSGREDSISGRTFGEGYAEKEKIITNLKAGNTFKVKISDKISFINDSFWKGFFNEVFKHYKTKDRVSTFFKFEASAEFENAIQENLSVLEAIYNH